MTKFTQWVPSWYSEYPEVIEGSFKDIMTSNLVMKFRRRKDFKNFVRNGHTLFAILRNDTWLIVGEFCKKFDVSLTDLPELDIY